MAENIDWKSKYAEADAYAEKQLEKSAAQGSIDRDFFGAALTAKRFARQDGLHPSRDEYGEIYYTTEQGIKAACHAREDVTAILIIQQAVLRRLQGLRMLGWACVLLLCYIAFRIS
ncbi:MAG: hypothetical protein PHD43_02125 [Methylococcales bacterium]|nr:hypothetical protein [Methylococcales bacterium]